MVGHDLGIGHQLVQFFVAFFNQLDFVQHGFSTPRGSSL
jgi:hypothetical protein